MLWLTGCAMGGSDGQVPCPPVVEYSTADQTRAAEEVHALPDGAILVRMLSDYAVLRDQVRTCEQGPGQAVFKWQIWTSILSSDKSIR